MSVQLQTGDFFVTRNDGIWVPNDSPGHWNHLAIMGRGTQVIEAQGEPYSRVIVSEYYEFLNRYPEILTIRFHYVNGEMAVNAIYPLVGAPYRTIASAFRFLRSAHRGENCVSLARKAYIGGSGKDPRWRRPDDALYTAHTLVWRKP